MVPAADQTVFHAECQVVTAVPCFTTPGPSPRPRHACAWKTRPTAVTARHGEARKDTVRRAGGCHPISRGLIGAAGANRINRFSLALKPSIASEPELSSCSDAAPGLGP